MRAIWTAAAIAWLLLLAGFIIGSSAPPIPTFSCTVHDCY